VRDLLEDLMDAAARRATYADARFVHTRVERLGTRNGAADRLDSLESEGIGVRVRVGGAWGFASCGGTEKADAEAALERALSVAAAQAPRSDAPAAGGSSPFAPEPPARGEYQSAAERDPFAVPLEDKLAVLVAADAGLRTEPGVVLTLATFEALRVDKLFASTEGALCRQVLTECGGGLTAVAVDGDESQTRSFPASHGGQVAQAGYEHFLSLDLAGEAPRVSEEAVALLRAPACPPGRRTVVLAGEQLGLQVHESIGHAVELDRVLGREASYAGTSFVPADGIGSLQLGSPMVNVTADAASPGGLGSFRWDDEGVEGRAVPIVCSGVLAGFLSSRETAAEIGLERSGGCMRADGHTRQPIVRMTNVNLEPGEAGTLEDLIAATDDGLLIDTNRSWSIDNRRLHFQFEGEAAWEISGGQRGRLLRNPSYAGVTPEFWASCDAVCSPSDWRLVSLLDCGKGEPGQVIRVSHGCAPARFLDVEVGVA
jgi:TldD protein